MNPHNMEYNSEKETLVIPEYGRNVQLMINYAKEIEDRAYRQAFAEKIIELMHQMNPQNKSIDDYRDKLWKHFFRIAQFDIDVIPSSGEMPTPESVRKRPEKVAYPVNFARYRHYGNNVQQLIKKAIEMPDGPKKDGFMTVVGCYMKLAYRTWNREHYVSDDIIKNDLKTLSGGKLILDSSVSLDGLGGSSNNNNSSNSNFRRRSSKSNNNKGSYKGRHSNNNHKGGGGRGRKRK